MARMVVLARHKWVAGATITESSDADSDGWVHRYTATIRGYRNWKIYEGRTPPNILPLIVHVVTAIRDQIDAEGENAVMAVNEYSTNTAELKSKARTFENPLGQENNVENTTYQEALADFHAAVAKLTDSQKETMRPGRGIRAFQFARQYVKPEEDQALYTRIYDILWNYFDQPQIIG